MIFINDVYLLVVDLISKDKAGYVSNAEFNWRSKVAEQVLWEFYASRFEQSEVIPDAMYPFMEESSPLPISIAGRVTVPADYGRRLTLWWNNVVNGPECGDDPVISKQGMNYIEKSELANTLSSAVRRPSVDKGNLYWTFTNAQIQVYPTDLKPSVIFEYLRYPNYAVRGITLDVANDQENYDAATTTNYEWKDQDQQNLIDLIMLQYGISNSDSEVLQFAAQQTSINKNIISQ